ncbi:hypothetical protein HYE68_004055 [Fusarium pseudograminearum]|nr:hypothetical protein HYE68_004055 [Fusarium pseudograminearum]
MSQARGVKKSANSEPGKRRTPYALRACEACRRRKGKCDGRQPCRHCASRHQNCSYNASLEANDDWQATAQSLVASNSNVSIPDQYPPSNHSGPRQPDQSAIVDMLSSLQAQLNSLAAQVNSNSNSNNPQQTNLPSPVTIIENATAVINQIDAENANSTTNDDTVESPRSSRTVTSQNFYGPTCPDYALNVGQLKLRHSLHQRQVQLASIHEDGDPDEDDVETQNGQFSMSPQNIDKGDPAMLLAFRSIISLQEAIQLLYVYQEVVGELHPVVDIDGLVMQTRSWYADAGAGVWDVVAASTGAEGYELLLIMNLCLAIALRADSKVGNINTEGLLRDSFQDAVNAKLAAPANSIRHATIIFLKGWYDFFHDMPRSAWRMCGIAGRMLMELGLHNAEVFKHTLKSEAQRTEACTLVSSIVILDRQWSYATGLPIHFHEKSFSSISTSSVKHPYLKAMLSFILISDRFSEPLSSAAKGEGYNDESSFELMTFQIEQWRKKAVESLGGSFSMAVNLTTKYTSRSRSARRLAKRLVEMRRNLLSLGILNAESPGSHEGLDGVTESVRRASLAQTGFAGGYTEYSPPFNTNSVFGSGIGMSGVDTDMQIGWDDPMRLQWPLGDVNHMFSESIF